MLFRWLAGLADRAGSRSLSSWTRCSFACRSVTLLQLHLLGLRLLQQGIWVITHGCLYIMLRRA